jgi:hypothetical protein
VASVKHIVLLKAKDGTSGAQIDGIFKKLRDLKSIIPGYQEFAGGPYSSQEGLNQGYTHGFIITFADATARDVYLYHPEHERIKGEGSPFFDAIIAFDFEAA